jgi:hypothetical protein
VEAVAETVAVTLVKGASRAGKQPFNAAAVILHPAAHGHKRFARAVGPNLEAYPRANSRRFQSSEGQPAWTPDQKPPLASIRPFQAVPRGVELTVVRTQACRGVSASIAPWTQ